MDEKLFQDLLTGLQEMVDHTKEKKELKTTTFNAKVSPIPNFTSKEIHKIRNDLRLSQPVFADILGVSKKTVEAWERGTNKPNGPACRLLKRLEENPESVKEYLIYL